MWTWYRKEKKELSFASRWRQAKVAHLDQGEIKAAKSTKKMQAVCSSQSAVVDSGFSQAVHLEGY